MIYLCTVLYPKVVKSNVINEFGIDTCSSNTTLWAPCCQGMVYKLNHCWLVICCIRSQARCSLSSVSELAFGKVISELLHTLFDFTIQLHLDVNTNQHKGHCTQLAWIHELLWQFRLPIFYLNIDCRQFMAMLNKEQEKNKYDICLCKQIQFYAICLYL